jgi:transcriptional regulator with XRE-family HTH domain
VIASGQSGSVDAIRIGSDVRLLRRRRRWSQRRLAAEAGVSRWVIATLESGRAGTVRITDAMAVVAALGA